MVRCKECGRRGVNSRNKYSMCGQCYYSSVKIFANAQNGRKSTDKDVLAFKKRLAEVFD